MPRLLQLYAAVADESGVMPDYLPRRDASLRVWTLNFSLRVAADPLAAGLTPEQSAAYTAAYARFAQAMERMDDLQRRNRIDIAEKDRVRDELLTLTRRYVRLVRAMPTLTDAELIGFGLRPTAKAVGQIDVPDRRPLVEVRSVSGHRVNVLIRLPGSSRKGWARGTIGAAIFVHVGGELPPAPEEWRFHGNASRPRTSIYFDGPFAPGTKVWISAGFLNPRLQRGPCSDATSAHLQAETMVPSLSTPVGATRAAA